MLEFMHVLPPRFIGKLLVVICHHPLALPLQHCWRMRKACVLLTQVSDYNNEHREDQYAKRISAKPMLLNQFRIDQWLCNENQLCNQLQIH
jgi:hypothetical protein